MQKALYSIVLLVLVIGAASARADTTLTYATEDGDFVIKIRPGAVRIDDASDRWQLYRESTDSIYSIQPKARSYVKMDKAAAGAIRAQMQTLRDQMEKQLAQLTESQRVQARAMMAQQVPGLDGKSHKVELDPTGSTDTVAGRKCEKIQVLRDGTPKETLCVASAKALGMSAKEFQTVESMFSLMQTMLAGTGLDQIGLPYLSLKGVPVRYHDRASKQTRTLKRVDHDKLPDLVFAIPNSYTAQSATPGR